MSRIQTTFAHLQAQGRKALIPYVMSGFPEAGCTPDLMHALVRGGADIIELGIPFSDPMADGPVIQAAGEKAIANGTGLAQVLDAVRIFREGNEHTPVVLMGYANSIEAYNLHHGAREGEPAHGPFVRAASAAGVDGVLVVDYPPEECATFAQDLREHGMDLIFLLAPTSTDARMEQIARLATGYVYYVSLKGVTGSGALDTSAVARAIPHIRQHVSIPVGVGFGIRDAATARVIAEHADAVVIGSRILQLIGDQSGAAIAEKAASFLQGIREAVDA